MNKKIITAFLLAVLMMIILLPARVRAEVPTITVTLNPGDGSGTAESFTSADSDRMASDYHSAGKGQFGVEDDSLWLRLPDLPSSFTPPSDNMIFTGWKFGNNVENPGYLLNNLTSDLTLTAQWGEAVNAKLLSLTPSSGTLNREFDPVADYGLYYLKVPYTGSPVSVTVEAVAQDPNASVKYKYYSGNDLRDTCPEMKDEDDKRIVVIKVTNGVEENSYTVELSLIYTLTLTTEGQGTAKAFFTDNNEGYTGGKGNLLLLKAAPADGWKFKEWQLVSGGGSLSYATYKNGQYRFGEDNAVVKAVFEHTHDFTYSLSGTDTIWATCQANNCWLDDGYIQGKTTLSIAAPEHRTYGDNKSAEAVITDVNNIRGNAVVRYYEADDNGDKIGNALAAAPTDAGKYRAEITLGEGDGARTAYTVYTIAGAPVTIGTTDKSAVYFPDGISVPVDSMFDIPDTAGSPIYTVSTGDGDTGEGSYDTDSRKLTVTKCGTFTVTVNTAENGNYAAAEASATLTVNKADYVVTAPVAETPFGATTLSYNGVPQKLVKAGSVVGNVGTMKYAVTTTETPAPEAKYYSKSIPTATNVGDYYVWYKVEGDENHNDYVAPAPVPVKIEQNKRTDETCSIATPIEVQKGESVSVNLIPYVGKNVRNVQYTNWPDYIEDDLKIENDILFFKVKSNIENTTSTDQKIKIKMKSDNYAGSYLEITVDVKNNVTRAELETPEEGVKTEITGVEVQGLSDFAGSQEDGAKVVLEVKPETEGTANGDHGAGTKISNRIGNCFRIFHEETLKTEYLDISLKKSVNGNTSDVNYNGGVIGISLLYDLSGKNNITILREHNGTVTVFKKLDSVVASGPASWADATYCLERATNKIHLYSKEFSTYAIAYVEGDSYAVTFDAQGGSPVDPIVVVDGETIPELPSATKSGYSFTGWNKQADGNGIAYAAGEPITLTSDLKLYAQWKQNSSGGGGTPKPASFTVHFETGEYGAVIAPQTVEKGKTATKPADPETEDFEFTGWFTDEECKRAYDFDTPVNADLILYAGWEKKEETEIEGLEIHFAELADNPYEGVCYNSEKDRYETVYTGDAITPLIRVNSGKDRVLKEDVDYSVSYSNNRNVSTKNPAKIIVSGKEDFSGKKPLELYILPADLQTAKDKGLLIMPDELKIQKGNKLNPAMVYRGYELKAKDRTLSNTAAINEDTEINITGKGNFTGTLEKIPVSVMDKADAKATAIKVSLKAGEHVYNGKAHKLTVTTKDAAGELTVTAGSSKTPLVEDTDFVVIYSNNKEAGTAKVTVTGIGDNASGTVVTGFKIEPDKTSGITAGLADPNASVYYSVKGAMPEIIVTKGEVTDAEVLELGKDYKVSYSSNKKIGEGSFTVKFIGNYKGHKTVKGGFTIVQAPINTAKVEAMQMIYKNPGKYLSKPFVSLDGVGLKTSDYTVKYYEGEITDVTAEGVKELTAKNKLELAEDEASKTVTIAVTGKGNYTGTALGTYKVVKAGKDTIDLTKAKIVAKDKDKKEKDVSVAKQEYTGKAIEPKIRVMVKVNKVWTDVDPALYDVSYINNVNKGTATILVSGNGTDTMGSKSAKFSITKMRMSLFRLFRISYL